MHLTSGVRLGAYEIVAPLGAGGMGEVYRARDTRLDRTVALKILPARFAGRAELRERFEREARVVSNLNHPNICALYDVGSQDDLAFLVMEYLEGQTLADRLAKGPLPLEQLLRYAVDITDALAKAHRHGIVHRDLKPGNVMITRAGAKLLDFGLARRSTETPVLMPDAETVHGAAPLTTEGTILGTLQYMSPEQLESGDVDARSDIFSLGALLYEMATGQRAFHATSHASLITKIMSEQPRPVREVAPVTPAVLEELIARCLQKEPDLRWQCAGDVAAELRAIQSGKSQAAAVAGKARKAIVPWAIAAALAVLAATLGALLWRRPAVEAEPVRFSIGQPTPGTQFATTVLSSPVAVSPDGRTVAFVASQVGERSLWIRRFDEVAAKRIEGTADAIAPFWSPDGKSVGFFADGTLRAVSLESGTVHKICDLNRGASATGAWNSDGTIVFSQLAAGDGLYVVSASGGTPKPIAKITGQKVFGYHYPRFLSDGKRFVFTAFDQKNGDLWLASLDESEPPRLIIDNLSHVDYVPPYFVFARGGALVAQRFDEDKLKLVGQPEALSSSVHNYEPTAHATFSAGGNTVAWVPYPPPTRLLVFDRSGNTVGEAGKPEHYYNARMSPDGTKLITTIADPSNGLAALSLLDLTRRTATRISFENVDYDYPNFSDDGKRIVYSMDFDGPAHLFTKKLGDLKDERLTLPGNIQMPTDWIGDRVFFSENMAATRSDIMTFSLKDRRSSVWRQTRFNEFHARVSRDGRWVAFNSDQTGGTQLFIAPAANGDDAVQVSTAGVNREPPIWRADGREIFFVSGREIFAAPVNASGTTIEAGTPVRLFSVPADVRAFDAFPDGKRFVIVLDDEGLSGQWISVVVNWKR